MSTPTPPSFGTVKLIDDEERTRISLAGTALPPSAETRTADALERIADALEGFNRAEAMQSENARLRETFKPFALFGKNIKNAAAPDDLPCMTTWGTILAKHFYAAAEAVGLIEASSEPQKCSAREMIETLRNLEKPKS